LIVARYTFFLQSRFRIFVPYVCVFQTGSRLIMGGERFISGSPLPSLSGGYTWFILFKVLRVSHRTFPPPAFLLVCRPEKGALQLVANGRRVIAAIPESRKVGWYQLSDHVATPLSWATPTFLCVNRRHTCHQFQHCELWFATSTSSETNANALCSAFHTRVTLWACNPDWDEVTQNGQ
jgi:hypothetical protein